MIMGYIKMLSIECKDLPSSQLFPGISKCVKYILVQD